MLPSSSSVFTGLLCAPVVPGVLSSARVATIVDDAPANIAAAASLGMDTHLFRGAGRLRADLTDRGLLDALVD